jgi:hypothetical protein
MERVADPTAVAALFSIVLVMRNKLHIMGHVRTGISTSSDAANGGSRLCPKTPSLILMHSSSP